MLSKQMLSKSEISSRLGQKRTSGQLNKVIKELLAEGIARFHEGPFFDFFALRVSLTASSAIFMSSSSLFPVKGLSGATSEKAARNFLNKALQSINVFGIKEILNRFGFHFSPRDFKIASLISDFFSPACFPFFRTSAINSLNSSKSKLGFLFSLLIRN